MPQSHGVGEPATLTGRFFNIDHQPDDPTTVSLRITAPDGTEQTIAQGSLSHPDTGVWQYTYVPASEGVYAYRYIGAGDPTVYEDAYFLVGPGALHGPCDDWATVAEVQACERCPDTNEGVIADAITAASELLYQLSGRRYAGICTTTTRPQPSCGCETRMVEPVPDRGDYLHDCGCCGDNLLPLGPTPVLGVFEVLVDGETLSSDAWSLVDRRALVRTDGGTWPCCQRLGDDPTSDPGTIRVRFAYGQEPPMLGRQAAAALACEIARDCVGADCQADERVISKTRQGMTVQLKLPGDLFDSRGHVRLGVRAVDVFLAGFGSGRRATISSPDIPRARRVV